MGSYRIEVSAPAENDLQDIAKYISAQFSGPATAPQMIDAMEKATPDLEDIPQRRPLVQEARLAMIGYRKLLVKSYIVFYTIDETAKVVDVERILYAKRDWRYICIASRSVRSLPPPSVLPPSHLRRPSHHRILHLFDRCS